MIDIVSLLKKRNIRKDNKLVITILPGFTCNLKCKMCYIWRIPQDSSVSVEKWINLIKNLKRFKNQYSSIEVSIGGGEPYLQNSIFKIFSECKRLGFRSNIITNGSLLTKKLIDKSIESGLTGISISLESIESHLHDSLRGIKGTFNKAMNAINYIKKTDKLELSIVTIIRKANLDDIVSLATWVQKLEPVAHSFQAISEPPQKPHMERW